jgi:hypothetical protein
VRSQLESRIDRLEHTVRRSRTLSAILGSVVAILVLGAMLPQETDELKGTRLVLTDADGEPSVVLLAGPESSLLVETPEGREVLRLGGPAVRRIGH